MNIKGFTLIELVAIIVVLSAIFLVSFPSFLNLAKTEDQKKYDNFVDDLCRAGKEYIYANIEEYNDNYDSKQSIDINILDLIKYGNIDKNKKNPKTNNFISEDTLTFSFSDSDDLECSYKDN